MLTGHKQLVSNKSMVSFKELQEAFMRVIEGFIYEGWF